MFGDPNSLLDDANEAKRRRIARVREHTQRLVGRAQPTSKENWRKERG
jgi:hypothetical protein